MFESQTLMREFPAPTEQQVTIANMLQGPFNRWAFRNMRRLLPSANVWRGEGAVAELPVALVALDDIHFAASDGVKRSVGEWLDQSYTDGFVVLHKGALIAERYWNGAEPHELHICMSVSKSVTGSLTGILVERGLLSPADLVTDILPELSRSAYDGATLRHVLDMTVGMDYDEDYEISENDLTQLEIAAGWLPYREGASDNLRDYVKTMRPAGEHGADFHYVSSNTHVLGWMLERASGIDFASLLSRDIWQRIGAEFDAYIILDRLGAPQPDGGLCMTTRDLARFGQLHLQNGVMNKNRIVPWEWIQDFRSNGDWQAWDRGSYAQSMPGHHYRNKWYTERTDRHQPYFGSGIHGQFVYIDPVASMVIAKHSSYPTPVEQNCFDDAMSAFKAIAYTLSDVSNIP